MIAPLLTLLLATAAVQGPKPDPAKVQAVVEALKSAYEKGGAPECVAAIERANEFVDKTLVEWVSKGLKHADKTVQGAALESLRHTAHPDAFAALFECLQRDKKLVKDPELHLKLIKAVGQHQNPAAIAKLADGGINQDPQPVIEARLLALANVRSMRAVEELVGILRGTSREDIGRYMPTMRLALMRLTGEDAGATQDAWLAWWNDRKKLLEVAEKPPLMPKDLQTRWDGFWGLPTDPGRARKRGERGGDESGGQ